MSLNNFSLANEFTKNSILNTSSLLRLNRFRGELLVPPRISEKLKQIPNDKLSWNIFQVNCPEMRLGIEAKEIDMIPRYYIKNWEYDDLTISFIEGAELPIKNFFVGWMSSFGLDMIDYTRHYFDDIAAESFKIFPIDNNNIESAHHEFRKVMPFKVNSHDFNLSGSDDEVVMTTVSFKYTNHSVYSA